MQAFPESQLLGISAWPLRPGETHEIGRVPRRRNVAFGRTDDRQFAAGREETPGVE